MIKRFNAIYKLNHTIKFFGLKPNANSYLRKSFASITDNANDPILKAQKNYTLGVSKWNLDDFKGAKEYFQLSINDFPTSDAYYNLANLEQMDGNHLLALEHWKESLKLCPRSDAHVNIANVLTIKLQNRTDALVHYKEALKLSPEDGEIHYNYAVVLDSMGQLESAIDEYTIAINLGIEMAEKNLRNAKAKLIASKAEQTKA
ncbi:hypothetical protein BC833DRAFT_592708 [Globomyces pollinis-pini]|nr:hypothetical protein BC833DRAFT_592708 [Globomyces pollinis-pini]